MARRRMIDPNIWDSEDFYNLSLLAKLVFIGMFSHADDEGRERANPTYLKSRLFPYDEKIQSADIKNALSEIAENLSVTFYSVGNGNYYSLDNWSKWQSIEKPKPSKIPAPPGRESCPRSVADQSPTNRRSVADESRLKERERERESISPPYSPPEGDDESTQGESLTVETARGAGSEKPVYHSTTLCEKRFLEFWAAYPRKVGKGLAEKAFSKIRPTAEAFAQMLKAIEQQKQSDQWRKNNGQFIPNPATWLNQRRWEDEPTMPPNPEIDMEVIEAFMRG